MNNLYIITVLNYINKGNQQEEMSYILCCPYCNKDRKRLENFSSPLNSFNVITDIMLDKEKRQSFFEGAKIVFCKKPTCKKAYYRTSYFDTYSGYGNPGSGDHVVAISLEEFKEKKIKYFSFRELVEYLPEENQLKSSYEDMIKSFDNKDSVRIRCFAIRAAIEAYTVRDSNEERVKNLSEAIRKLTSLSEEERITLTDIILPNLNKGAHINPRQPSEDIMQKAFKFVELFFAIKFKFPKQKEDLYKEQELYFKEIEVEHNLLLKSFNETKLGYKI